MARALLVALVLALLAPASLAVADDPQITHAPEVDGTPQVGHTLTAVNAEWEGEDVEVTWRWYECANGDLDSCDRIPDTNATSYTIREDDAGQRLRVRLRVRNDDGTDIAFS